MGAAGFEPTSSRVLLGVDYLRATPPYSFMSLVSLWVEDPIRHIEVEVLVTKGHEPVDVPGVQCLISAPDELDVLLRHRAQYPRCSGGRAGGVWVGHELDVL